MNLIYILIALLFLNSEAKIKSLYEVDFLRYGCVLLQLVDEDEKWCLSKETPDINLQSFIFGMFGVSPEHGDDILENCNYDLNILRLRYKDLKNVPSQEFVTEYLSSRGYGETNCLKVWEFYNKRVEVLERQVFIPRKQEQVREAITQNKQSATFWFNLSMCLSEDCGIYSRRMAFKTAVDVIGEDNFYQGLFYPEISK